jgi:SAM-dependent methyltransferase
MTSKLVCPRDRLPLVCSRGGLTCAAGHSYPVHDGIPVFIIGEVEQTHPSAERALQVAHILSDLACDDGETPPLHDVHPFVRDVLVGTCGNLYAPIARSIDHYPIPELPLQPERQGDRFVEIGCNWGRWSIAAAQQGYSVTAVDANFRALVVARRIFRQFGLTGTFICADARHLPFAPRSFDLAFSYSVFMYFSKEDARAAIAETARVTAGRSLIQMANKHGIHNLYHRARGSGSADDPLRVRYWSRSELLSVFNELVGPSFLSIDGVIGRSVKASELESLLPRHRIAVRLFEWLRKFRILTPVSGSLYVHSRVGGVA